MILTSFKGYKNVSYNFLLTLLFKRLFLTFDIVKISSFTLFKDKNISYIILLTLFSPEI